MVKETIISILFFALLFNLNFNRVKNLVHLYGNKNYIIKRDSKFQQKFLSESERKSFLKYLPLLEGTKYKEGGSSIAQGLDCSGVIVYVFNKLGYKWFRDSTWLVNDISADKLYHYNVKKFYDFKLLRSGDFIFFDSNNDNNIEHVSIFSKIDNKNNVWVWDASDFSDGKIVNKVSYRKINNISKKNPTFGIPLVTCETRTFWDTLAFP